MMKLARRASLVVVLLLASVGTASAECAWVLWSNAATLPSGPDYWGVIVAYSSDDGGKAACEAFAKNARKLEENNDLVRRTGRNYVCLPDTIDPREEGEMILVAGQNEFPAVGGLCAAA